MLLRTLRLETEFKMTAVRNRKIVVCYICGQKAARIRKVTEAYGKGKNILIIENVPMVRCSKCGETYFTAETLHEIERIKLHRKSFATERPVDVASFSD